MNDRKPVLFLLLGAWLSFSAIVLAGTALLPPAPEAAKQAQALLYRVALEQAAPLPESAITPTMHTRSILADLDSMTISLIEDGVSTQSFPILSKGRAGTFWETPTGTYAIGTKEVKHFSSIGETWMPYSLQFYGNFFIHGWPTYPDGTPVAKGYSGGCIRLATEDAQAVYTFADRGMKVSVIGGMSARKFATTSQYYLRAPELMPDGTWSSSTIPDVNAEAFIVADVESGEVLWQRSAHATVTPGALVALASALTALETVDQYKHVRMGELLLDQPVARRKASGAPDEVTLGALIYPLLFSGDDTAAKAFASEHGTRSFTRAMNEKALAIGMDETRFSGPLSSSISTTTAEDLLVLLRYVNDRKRFLIDASRSTERTFVAADGKTEFHWDNKSPWIESHDARYRGGVAEMRPSGAGSAMVLFAVPVAEFSERTIAIIIPHSSTLREDVAALRSFVMERYVYGIERDTSSFIREPKEPTPSLLYQIKNVLDLSRFLDEEIQYEREV